MPSLNSLRPRLNRRYNTDDITKCIFLKENFWIPTIVSLKFDPKGPINNIPALVQIMAWRRPGDKPLSEPMMVSLLTHICVTRPQWVNSFNLGKEAFCPKYMLPALFNTRTYKVKFGVNGYDQKRAIANIDSMEIIFLHNLRERTF